MQNEQGRRAPPACASGRDRELQTVTSPPRAPRITNLYEEVSTSTSVVAMERVPRENYVETDDVVVGGG